MRKILLTAALVGLLALPLFAQRPGGGSFGGGQVSESVLLANKGVQEELKLTDAQKAAIAEVSTKMRESFGKGKFDKETFKSASDEAAKATAKIVEGLSEQQKKRLRQIEIQVGGLRALTKDEVATALNLTDTQKAQIKEIADETTKDVSEMMKNARGDKEKFAEVRTKTEKLRKEALDRVTKTFNDEQKKTYKNMAGEPFNYQPEFGGGAGRPGRNKGKGTPDKKDI